MSAVRGFALPVPIACPQRLDKPARTVARIFRLVQTISERRRLDRVAPGRRSCHPVVLTLFPFNIRDLIGFDDTGECAQ